MSLGISFYYMALNDHRNQLKGCYMLNDGKVIYEHNIYSVALFQDMSKTKYAMVKYSGGKWEVAEL